MHMISPAERACLLKNRLFAGFSAAELDELLEKLSARAVSLPKNSVLWGMGERVTSAGLVLSGRVEAWRYTESGQASLSAVHEAGGLFGDVLMSARTVGSPVELRTAQPSKILFLSLDALAETAARACFPIFWKRSRKNTGPCRRTCGFCPSRTAGAV